MVARVSAAIFPGSQAGARAPQQARVQIVGWGARVVCAKRVEVNNVSPVARTRRNGTREWVWVFIVSECSCPVGKFAHSREKLRKATSGKRFFIFTPLPWSRDVPQRSTLP